MSGETIGIIYPPPELRNIVDKTASFVARNGPEFESRIQQNEQNNSKFNFLKTGDPYHAYYQHKVKEFKDGSKGGEISAPPSAAINYPSSTHLQQQKLSRQLELFAETTLIPREPPPEFEYMSDPPSISALDLDIVKLTAQFVAIHGRSFLTNLMNREQRNYQFDFLRPQHGLFCYFTQLIEQYTKILMPAKNLLNDLKRELLNPKTVLDKVKYRLEWTKIQEAEKRREQEEAEKERIQYAQIDWHDFVVVETVDYQPHEQGLFPPPTTPEQVGSRILLQQRIEEQGEAIEMDVESDEEESEAKKNEEAIKPKESMPPPLPPLPPQLDNVLIRKDYNPKANKAPQAQQQQTPSKSGEAWVISPITGEKIPAEKLQEHMRYGLLDPRWVEQRDRAIQEKMEQEEVYAPGSAIESSLKQLAERRTDIFGSGDEETAIGKKIGEEERKKPEKVTWDGYTASMEAATRAARANITIEEQIQQIHKMKGLLPDEDKEKIGPIMPTTSAGSHIATISAPPLAVVQQQKSVAPQQLPTASMVITTANVNPPSHQQPRPPQQLISTTPPQIPFMSAPQSTQPSSAFMMTPSPMLMGMYGMSLPPSHDIHSGHGVMPLGGVPMGHTEEDQPLFKKPRTEDNLMSEEDFIRRNSGPVTFKVQVPNIPSKPEWKLNGQTLTLSLPLTDLVSVIKVKIHELIGMPPGKQKLQYEGMFIKDSCTLAYYNIAKGGIIVLGLKERGGKKK
ncbi:splicing factor 3A subunit 1-like protein [Dinothrombium tinctorium]|uniref:Splicing factor 3A subunit 1 n=1 Tax=Dinothrombium tinctorium TaxID=1965070 RepID=A0A3S3RW83_9ACAR|nr:splicing factor 3A subunit 1-like protein [Dinothrombium tinctorium]RWS06935.1 splicing factor 3A subunit 1-like protein [Dinothrombium tinctorium]